MQFQNKATSLWGDFFKLTMPQIRAFHMAWFSFFLCFFAWFGIAPLMTVVRDELQLTQTQVGWSMIASVAITVLARLVIGWLCDRIGPRLAYTWLLVVGSIPVMMIGFAQDPGTFIFFRLLVGVIGAFSGMDTGGGKSSIDAVAGPIAEALYVTAAGIAVAVESVVIFNFINQRMARMAGEMKMLTDEFLEELVAEGPESGGTAEPVRPRHDDERKETEGGGHRDAA